MLRITYPGQGGSHAYSRPFTFYFNLFNFFVLHPKRVRLSAYLLFVLDASRRASDHTRVASPFFTAKVKTIENRFLIDVLFRGDRKPR